MNNNSDHVGRISLRPMCFFDKATRIAESSEKIWVAMTCTLRTSNTKSSHLFELCPVVEIVEQVVSSPLLLWHEYSEQSVHLKLKNLRYWVWSTKYSSFAARHVCIRHLLITLIVGMSKGSWLCTFGISYSIYLFSLIVCRTVLMLLWVSLFKIMTHSLSVSLWELSESDCRWWFNKPISDCEVMETATTNFRHIPSNRQDLKYLKQFKAPHVLDEWSTFLVPRSQKVPWPFWISEHNLFNSLNTSFSTYYATSEACQICTYSSNSMLPFECTSSIVWNEGGLTTCNGKIFRL